MILVASKISGRSIRSCIDKYILLLERDELKCIEKISDDSQSINDLLCHSSNSIKCLAKQFYPGQKEILYNIIID